MDTTLIIRYASRIIGLVVLVIVLLGILTWTGVVKPNVVPGWCSVYWSIAGFQTGGPKVLLVYGNDGLGNPVGPCEPGLEQCSLEELLENPEIAGIQVDTMRLSSVNLGNLRNYNLVIVDKAKTMETKQMRAFIDYYAQGGRLVWIGDSGTELGPDDQYLYANERNNVDANKIIGPWARKDGDVMVSLDYVLSVRYKTNLCKAINCDMGKTIYAGKIVPETSGEHSLIKGMSAALPLYVFKDEDFAVVETISGGITTEVLTLDTMSNLIGTGGQDFGRDLPFIVTSGIGERAVYFAMPPEYFANPKLSKFEKGPYLLPIENLYYGMLCG